MVENVGHYKVQQRHKLDNAVLKRCASEQQLSSRFNLNQALVSNRVHVLQHVSLVKDTVLELELPEERLVLVGATYETVRGQYAVEMLLEFVVENVEAELATFIQATLVHGEVEVRRPGRDLAHPVVERGRRHDYEMRELGADLEQVSEERDRLTRLAQAHLVGQNAVYVLLVHEAKPVETDQLIRFEL